MSPCKCHVVGLYAFQQFLFVNTDVLRTDCRGQSTTYGATAATASAAGGDVLISVDNAKVLYHCAAVICTLLYTI